MKTIYKALSGAAASMIVLAGSAFAADEAMQPVTLEGKATCEKCDLGKAEKCNSVLVVGEDDATVTYNLAGEAGGEWHKKVCMGAKEVKMTGTVEEMEGKKTFVVTEINEFDGKKPE